MLKPTILAVFFLAFGAAIGAQGADAPRGMCIYNSKQYTEGGECASVCNHQTNSCQTQICRNGVWVSSSCKGMWCKPFCCS
jgi:hypothetical protein